jgi:HSP20 family protein
MSWDDDFDEDPRKKIRRWFGDFLPEDMFRQIEGMIDRMLDDLGEGAFLDSRSLEEFMRDPQGTNPFVFGFSMTMGPDGKPTIQRFGNVSPNEDGIKMSPQLEPLVDIIEEDDEIIVVAELPGVERDEIKVRIKGTTLTIHVENPARPYHKELALPSKVKKEDASSAIRNGILEVRLKKA